MNEQRSQADLNLINQLLSCNQGDESRILQENQELLDQGLIETMIAVARQFGDEGEENNGQWLINIAQQLADDESTEITNSPQDYLNFFEEVFQKVIENDDSQLMYPFLTQNLDKLDETLANIIYIWSKRTLSSVDTKKAPFIAGIISGFSDSILQFPLGNIAINKGIAITGYEIALNIFTFDAFSEYWAMRQMNLAIAYSERIRGDKAENIEIAIAAYTEVLKVYTFDKFPFEWAMTQHNLAVAYLYRIRGNKAENIEKAIAVGTEALKVRTFDAFPEYWAMTKINLALAYSSKIKDNKAENLEQAIAAYTEALKVYTFDAFRYEWATIQNNLSNSYRDRIRGNKAENLEKAISACTEALKVRTFDASPKDWAITQTNLATAYLYRIRGEKAENLEKAIAAYTEALKVYTFDNFPHEWATDKEKVKVWQSSETNLKEFKNDTINYLQLYFAERGKWVNQLPELLQTFADILHINEILTFIPDTCQLETTKFKQVLNHLQETLSFGDFFELEDAIAVTCDKIKEMSPNEKPFKNPFYWAAFTATGI